MTAVQRVAIVGAGVTGLAAAIRLARADVEVDVFEAKPSLVTQGSGITLQGNALRVFDDLGAWDDIRAAGYAFDGLQLRAPGPDAPIVAELPDVRTGGPDYPAAMGMPRADLARILLEHAERAGARVHFGTRLTGVEELPEGVRVQLDDGSSHDVDLLIGADGLHSTVREAVGIDTKPQRNGMGIWRAFVSRPESVDRTALYYGGPVYIAGYTPTSEDSMYAFLVEPARDHAEADAERARSIMIEQSHGYGGPWESIRADIAAGAPVNYTWFTHHLIDGDWHRGRVVVIGDAAHSCPPTIAQGAAQGLEDALVLTELLLARDAIDESLWGEFLERRVSRAKTVVDASVQLAQWQMDGNRDADAPGLIFGVAQQMAQPA